METDEFRRGIDSPLGYAAGGKVALMCSEAVWWRCHRALVADYLKSLGVSVYHIMKRAVTSRTLTHRPRRS